MPKPCFHFDICWYPHEVKLGCRLQDTFVFWNIPMETAEDFTWINNLLNTDITLRFVSDTPDKRWFGNAHVPVTEMWAGKYAFQQLTSRAGVFVIRTLDEQKKAWERQRQEYGAVQEI